MNASMGIAMTARQSNCRAVDPRAVLLYTTYCIVVWRTAYGMAAKWDRVDTRRDRADRLCNTGGCAGGKCPDEHAASPRHPHRYSADRHAQPHADHHTDPDGHADPYPA